MPRGIIQLALAVIRENLGERDTVSELLLLCYSLQKKSQSLGEQVLISRAEVGRQQNVNVWVRALTEDLWLCHVWFGESAL